MNTPATQDHLKDAPPVDAELVGEMNALLGKAGIDTTTLRGKRLREVLHTAIKLHRDGADMGEVKLISQSLKELRYALKMFRPYRDTPKISIFGSARTPVDHPDYKLCVDFARAMSKDGWMVITGAGDGIMRAGHDGAERPKSFGVSIRLPFETNANDIIEGDEKLATFRYFFTRKLTFMWHSAAVALFPGGFGTQDEGYEALTLIQTGKASMVPIVLVEPDEEHGGSGYWKQWIDYTEGVLLKQGWISPEDRSLYRLFHDADEAAKHVQQFYANYDSMRFVRDTCVIRIKHELPSETLEEINDRFGTLIKSGKIEQHPGPIDGEYGEKPELPRLVWDSTKRAYGQLRQMIDVINGAD